MLLYFSSEKNRNIFSKINEDIDIKVENTNHFLEYIEKNRNNLYHIDFLAIDLESVIDEEDILKELISFRMLNSKTEIIIVALEKTKGDLFLGKLFYEGIYNFITSKDEFEIENEIKACINKENNYSNSMGYRVEEVKQEPKEKEKPKLFGNIFGSLKKEKTNRKKEKNKESKKENENIPDILKNENFRNVECNNNFTEKIENNDFTKNIIKEEVNTDFLEEQVTAIFGNTNFSNENKQKNKNKLELDYIDDMTALFYYYQKAIGLYSKENNNCVIDSLFEKEDIKDYLKNKEINFIFKENTIEKIKSLEKIFKGGGYQN